VLFGLEWVAKQVLNQPTKRKMKRIFNSSS
jgi:hypothetical protein